MSIRTVWAASVYLLLAGTAFAGDEQIFSGKVARGETFHYDLDDGRAFRLTPIAEGWTIWIGDPARPTENHVAIATPPFRGINPIYIEGWHFRNSDNSAPNKAGPNNVNAPQRARDFRYFVDPADFDRALAALRVMLWPGGHSPAEIEAAEREWGEIGRGHGRLTIASMELGNLIVEESAWIERMTFDVRLGGDP